jgi:hypothetical protein
VADYHLPVHQQNAMLELIERLPDLETIPSFEMVVEFCHYYRIKGIASLFVDYATRDFLQDLDRSARAFLHYLETRGSDEQLASRSSPLFDAIACNDLECAAEIARFSTNRFRPDVEYEEDFLYFRFVCSDLLESAHEEKAHLVERYMELAEGRVDGRLALCLALQAQEARAFDEALELLIDEHKTRYAELRDSQGVAEEELLTEGHLCVEGLAWVRLAERRGIETRREYPLIPSAARKEVSAQFAPDSWRRHLAE